MLKPKFWGHSGGDSGHFKASFNFRRIWQMTVLLMALVSLVPLIVITLVDYSVTQNAIELGARLRTANFASNTRRTLHFFLDERLAVLNFIIRDHSYEELADRDGLESIFNTLRKVVGGFSDLGVIDAAGNQITYVGPYALEGRNYRDQDWFEVVVENGVHISEVFMGFRKVPHIIIAVKKDLPDGLFYILRSAVSTTQFAELMTQLEVHARGDVFTINHSGILQTPSRIYGDVLQPIPIPVPEYSPTTEVIEVADPDGQTLIVGYSYIADTPFINMVVRPRDELMAPWYRTRTNLIGFLVGSITIILLVILAVASYLVNRLYLADQRRAAILHHVEHANKMASIGRLAAGVAHEINNPLAIINEKAGLIKDVFTFDQRYQQDERLTGIADSILSSVARCAAITRRLLGFSSTSHIKMVPIDLNGLIREVLSFMGKEAEYRSITVAIDIPEDVPAIISDRGKLQEVFLNLFNNAFAAMSDGGRLEISARQSRPDSVDVSVTDDGSGISEAHMREIFEPFFSTKTHAGGTGLGLSITQGLVSDLGGAIDVRSQVGVGTTFTITFPLETGSSKSES
ncbi:MAG: ATP-binding protein [Planctomycetota bacterium]